MATSEESWLSRICSRTRVMSTSSWTMAGLRGNVSELLFRGLQNSVNIEFAGLPLDALFHSYNHNGVLDRAPHTNK